jgi:hypothetical protein
MAAGRAAGVRPTTSRRFLVAARLRALSIVCFVLYALTQVGSAITGWVEFVSKQQQHGSPPQIFGDDGFIWTFLEQTMQNWQSEFLALTVLVALTSVLLHRGSKHSRDGTDEAKAQIEKIQERVTALVSQRQGAS